MSNLAYTDDYKERFELIDGKIIMMLPRPRIAHSRALGNIFREFSIYLKGKKCEAFADGVDVYLDEKNHFIPIYRIKFIKKFYNILFYLYKS